MSIMTSEKDHGEQNAATCPACRPVDDHPQAAEMCTHGDGCLLDEAFAKRSAAFERENRIRANRRLLETLADLWDAVPDQRFGQLVMNLSRENGPGRFADTWEWKHGDWRARIEEAWTTWAKP